MRHARELATQESAQVLVVVGLFLSMLMGLVGLALDISWYQINVGRIQRAADAGALAGVVYLPGNLSGAKTAALNEASKNGYPNGVGGVVVTADAEALNDKVLNVRVSASTPTFFARLLGVAQFPATRNARAEFVLPVPMGSPQSYYGVNVLCRNSDTPPGCPPVASASGAGDLAPLGFFGGVLSKGAERANGDPYSTWWNVKPSRNLAFDADGYSYIVEFGPGTIDGRVWLYDAIFCATGVGTSSGRRLGTGDFWYGNGGQGIDTQFNLFDQNGTPYSPFDDVLVATSGSLFVDNNGVDRGPDYTGNGNYGAGYGGGGAPDCQASPYHNNWWLLHSGLGPGEYRLQVVTSMGNEAIESAVNSFGIEATAVTGPSARVYGQSRMCAYAAVANSSVFYLAQVEAAHAGKTLEIKLFDPGDIGNTSLRIRMPTATGFSYASFTWTATGSSGGAPVSGGPTTTLQTSNGSVNYYNNQWVTLTVQLPSNYTAPQPSGEPGPGWWKIEYAALGFGQDVTTWEVSIRGNPVHLIVP